MIVASAMDMAMTRMLQETLITQTLRLRQWDSGEHFSMTIQNHVRYVCMWSQGLISHARLVISQYIPTALHGRRNLLAPEVTGDAVPAVSGCRLAYIG